MIQGAGVGSRRSGQATFPLANTILAGVKWIPGLVIAGMLCLVLGHFMWGWLDTLQDWQSGSEAMAPGWVESAR